jgi:hypothetical protein
MRRTGIGAAAHIHGYEGDSKLHFTIFFLAIVVGGYIHDGGYPRVGYFLILIATIDLYQVRYGRQRAKWKKTYAEAGRLSPSNIFTIGPIPWLKARGAAKNDWNRWCDAHDVPDRTPIFYYFAGACLVFLILQVSIPAVLEDFQALYELIESNVE